MKKLLCLVLFLVMSTISIFSGCSLIVTNDAKALKAVVASVDNITITREELINYYQSYGSQLVSSYDYTVQEAIEQTIDAVLKLRLIARYSKETLGELDLTDTNAVMQDVYDYINNSILSIEKTFNDYVADTTTDEESDWPVYTPYVSEITKVNGVYVKDVADRTLDTEEIGDFVLKINGDADRTNRAYEKYISSLRLNSAYRGDNITDENTLFQNEINRLYNIYETEKYAENLQTYFNDNQAVDSNAILTRYKELVRDSYAKYTINKEAYDAVMMTQSGTAKWNTVYYHPYANQYVLVAHILLKFNDDTLATTYSNQLASGEIDQVRYNELIGTLASSITTYSRDEDGNDTETVLTKEQVMSDINAVMSAAGSNVSDRAQAFNTLMYKYSQDSTSTESSEYMCINIDETLDDGTMDAKFMSAVRDELYDEGNGVVGSYTDWVVSSFGVHVIFYAGIIDQGIDDNLNTYANIENTTLEMLDSYKFNLGTEKTLLDVLYEEISMRDYSTYEAELYEQIKSDLQANNKRIVYYENNYKDLF